MKIAIVAFSECGRALANLICKSLEAEYEVKKFVSVRHEENVDFEAFTSIYKLAEKLFNEMNAIVFVGACGIAVRAVAPLVKSKLTDPAIVVCDETGRFAISLLSGHAGGANALTEKIASKIEATPVITTASDSHAALGGMEQPKNLVLGIGCRRGISAEVIERTATILLWDYKIPLLRIGKVATIDVKRDEEGLMRFAEVHGLPLYFYSAEELRQVEGEFVHSDRVLRTVGVDNVCERAAALCGGEGKLIIRKTAQNGVTIAVFEEESIDG